MAGVLLCSRAATLTAMGVAVRAPVNKPGICPIESDQQLSRHHAEWDEKVDRRAVATESYKRRVHGVSWRQRGGAA